MNGALPYFPCVLLRRTGDSCTVLGEFAKLRKATVGFVISDRVCVRPHGKSGLPLDGFSLNFIFEYFSKIVKKIQVVLESDKKTSCLT
jgi:hypothetical protein